VAPGGTTLYYKPVDERQSMIVKLPQQLIRKTRAYISSTAAYEDLSELVLVALENQLALDGSSEEPTPRAVDPGESLGRAALVALRKPDVGPPVIEAIECGEPLFSMTNRLFPLKVAARVLANTTDQATLHDFQHGAAEAARALGQKLRGEDARAGRKGAERRWIALPVGEDEQAALSRFVHHFALTLSSDGVARGPLAYLGLAALLDGRPRLTELGLEFALAHSPVLDDDADAHALLTDDERQLLIRGILANRGEILEVREFLRVARHHGGRQHHVDAALRIAHDSWSEAQAVAQRAAMVGRLRDLGLASVEGRGPAARIRLADGIESHLEEREADDA